MLHKDCTYNATKENLLACITAAYVHQQKLLTQDHQPLTWSLYDWPMQPVSSMKLWLKRNLPYIQHCLKVTTAQSALISLDIWSFMIGSPCTAPQPSTKQRRCCCCSSSITHQSILNFTSVKRRSPHTSTHVSQPKSCTPKLQDKPLEDQKHKLYHQLNLFESLFKHSQ